MKDPYEVNVDLDLANKDAMTIFINYKVFDYDGVYIGATGVGLTVDAVIKRIGVYQEKYNRTIYFIDRSGDVKLAGAAFDRNIKNISQVEYYPLFKDRLGLKAETAFSYSINGSVIHTNIRYIEEFDWYLVVEQSEKETIEKIHTTLEVNLIVCVLITLIVVFLVNYTLTAYQKRIETLRGIVPICSFCKQIRDDRGYWNKVEAFVSKHTDAQFSHSVCPECMIKEYPEEAGIVEDGASSDVTTE